MLDRVILDPSEFWSRKLFVDLFVYGTLMVPEIMFAVCRHRGPGQPATLFGYHRRRVTGEAYPAITRCDGEQVQGICHSGLSAAQGRLLDSFEGEMYRRHTVSIRTALGERLAEAYVLAPHARAQLSREPWSLESFVATQLDGFMRSYSGFAALPVEE